MTGASLDLDIFKDIPGYKGILKAVLKYQIQLLVEQLCEHGGEESVLLSANVTEGTLSHLGSEAGKGFLTDNNDVKRQYLGYCLKAHQKRKSEFMSPSPSHEDIQSVKLIRSNPESVLSYPVHKKPYYRVQRRNTRIRSGGKQFSSFYSKAGLNRPTLQKIAASGGYMVSGENPYQRHSNETMCQIESPRQHETLKTQYESQRSEEQGQSSDVVVKTEIQTNDNNSSEENVTSQNKPEVTVKVEPSDNIDEAGDKVVSAVISEDIQTFGDGMGHQFSPNTSMETEDSFSEGNQSFEYVLDRENSEDIITPWKPDEAEKMSQITSKRKQALPTRITKSVEQKGKDKNSSNLFSQSPQSYGEILSNQKAGSSEWFGHSPVKSNHQGTTGISLLPSFKDRNQGINSSQHSFRNPLQRGENVTENMQSRMHGSVWTQEQVLDMSSENTTKNTPYGEMVEDRSGVPKGVDMNWSEEGFPPGGFKTYMKTPQIDGLFVSRGEGRYEKLIKCEDCGKVCRTSNMARHKKRYCTALPKVGQMRKNYAHRILLPRPVEKTRLDTGLKTDLGKNTVNTDLNTSLEMMNNVARTKAGSVDCHVVEPHIDKNIGNISEVKPFTQSLEESGQYESDTDTCHNKTSEAAFLIKQEPHNSDNI